MKLNTFSRKELENLSLEELKSMAEKYNAKVQGKPGHKVSYTNSLSMFDKLACHQCACGVGICADDSVFKEIEILIEKLRELIRLIGVPTESQMMVITAAIANDEWIEEETANLMQQKMVSRYQARYQMLVLLKVLTDGKIFI